MVAMDQLELFDSIVLEEGMTSGEIEALMRDFLARYSDTVTTSGALRARRCECDPHGLPLLDREDHSRRCLRCGRVPRSVTI